MGRSPLLTRLFGPYAASMAVETITFEISEELIATVDEIASHRSVTRAVIMQDALEEYLANYQDLQADIEEGERQIAAGETVPHEEVVAWFKAKYPELDKSEAV